MMVNKFDINPYVSCLWLSWNEMVKVVVICLLGVLQRILVLFEALHHKLRELRSAVR